MNNFNDKNVEIPNFESKQRKTIYNNSFDEDLYDDKYTKKGFSKRFYLLTTIVLACTTAIFLVLAVFGSIIKSKLEKQVNELIVKYETIENQNKALSFELDTANKQVEQLQAKIQTQQSNTTTTSEQTTTTYIAGSYKILYSSKLRSEPIDFNQDGTFNDTNYVKYSTLSSELQQLTIKIEETNFEHEYTTTKQGVSVNVIEVIKQADNSVWGKLADNVYFCISKGDNIFAQQN